MKCTEQKHTMKNKKIVSEICGKDLDVVEGNGTNQYYDITMECLKAKDGCGFKKKMGNEKWLACHCQHCKKELTGEEKNQGLTCGVCKDGGLL